MQLSNPFDEKRSLMRNRSAYAVKDRYPVATGHMLVVPQRSVRSIFDLPADELADVWSLVAMVREGLCGRFGAESFTVGVNDGADAGQTVEQAHVHIIPREPGDNPSPAGGVRAVIPGKADWRAKP